MDVHVIHNGTTEITGFVESYEREHKICTGIGLLSVEIVNTIGISFAPWDSIDIYENGVLQVRYYISNIENSVPKGLITLECQDRSKRLVDYFIPDSYNIDYPSYTRYWIEKFLAEAGVSYSFTTSSSGSLISNNTQLGLTSAYEQVLTLLQMSGWYMYFNGTGTAIIGSLESELTSSGSIEKTDILHINVISDDKMLRNRALVLGAFDSYTMTYATADVSVHTPWNYDHQDKRAIVISNSNIPNVESAYGMANQIIKEFARITVEKHITVWGARDFDLGTTLRVTSNVWKGRGLITSFGTSMSKLGLVTNLVLDERCPRLFGFFDFGDYVYVGTFGDGIWRKHIKFDPTWYDFSTGLTSLEITDLHINNGVFGSVTSSGEMFRTTDLGGWSKITLESLESSVAETIPSGGVVTYTTFSGLSARGVIVDKYTNALKFGIDNSARFNYGDYFIDYSGYMSSGIVASGSRGWIVEYDPFTGIPVGGLGSGIFPIHYSGSYQLAVIDIENNGLNDFVSVVFSGGMPLPNDGSNYDLGFRITQPYGSTYDGNALSVAPSVIEYVNTDGDSEYHGVEVRNYASLIAVDQGLQDYRVVVGATRDYYLDVLKVFKEFNELTGKWDIRMELTRSTDAFAGPTVPTNPATVVGVYAESTTVESNLYTVFYFVDVAFKHNYMYRTYNAASDTWSAPTLLGIAELAPDTEETFICAVNGIIYVLRPSIKTPLTAGGRYVSPSRLWLYLEAINMSSKSFTSTKLLEFFTEANDDGFYEFFPATDDRNLGENLGVIRHAVFNIFQNGTAGVKIMGWAETYQKEAPTRSREYIFSGDQSSVTYTNIYDDIDFRFTTGGKDPGRQLSLYKGYVGKGVSVAGNDGFIFDGSTFTIYSTVTPFYRSPSSIYPLLNASNNYVAIDGSTGKFFLCNADGMTQGLEIAPPDPNIALLKAFSTPLSNSALEFYILVLDDRPGVGKIGLAPCDGSFINMAKAIYPTAATNLRFGRNGINFGGWFITEPVSYLTLENPFARCVYVDLGTPEWTGKSFMVLERVGEEFNLIQQATYPIRLDISNTNPVLTVGSGDSTFVSNFIYGSGLVQVAPSYSFQTIQVNDYRYSLLEPVLSGIVVSGLALASTGLYVSGSGLYGMDIETYSGGMQLLYRIPSGIGTRIETSNYGLGGQYIFVTVSGDMIWFHQQDPGTFSFTSYSGLPDSRPTIIRLDDAI